MARSRRRPDGFAKRARREGYAARSVYKLDEIDQRFSLLRKGIRVLEIGSSPGSWSQRILERIGHSGSLVAVDLQPTAVDDARMIFIEGDMTSATIREAIGHHGPYDLLLSDAAPKTTGTPSLDALRSSDLVEQILALSDEILVPGSTAVMKVYQGAELPALLDAARRRFERTQTTKPQASRSESVETYLIGRQKYP